MLKQNKNISFKEAFNTDMGIFVCISLIYFLLLLFIGLILVADNISTTEMKNASIFFIPTLLVIYLFAYVWYLAIRHTLVSGILCCGKIIETDFNKNIALPLYITIIYDYEYNGMVAKHYELFRASSKAKNIAVMGKEITVMRSKFGGFSFIRDVYEDDAEKTQTLPLRNDLSH